MFRQVTMTQRYQQGLLVQVTVWVVGDGLTSENPMGFHIYQQ